MHRLPTPRPHESPPPALPPPRPSKRYAALRDAVRAYLATVGDAEVTPRCAAAIGCSAPATGIVRWGPSAEGRREGRYLCHAHAVSGDHHASLPPRVVALRALAALVRS